MSTSQRCRKYKSAVRAALLLDVKDVLLALQQGSEQQHRANQQQDERRAYRQAGQAAEAQNEQRSTPDVRPCRGV